MVLGIVNTELNATNIFVIDVDGLVMAIKLVIKDNLFHVNISNSRNWDQDFEGLENLHMSTRLDNAIRQTNREPNNYMSTHVEFWRYCSIFSFWDWQDYVR